MTDAIIMPAGTVSVTFVLTGDAAVTVSAVAPDGPYRWHATADGWSAASEAHSPSAAASAGADAIHSRRARQC